MLHDLDYDDTGSPAIGLVAAGVSWDDVRDHIKIAHGPLLLRPDGSSEYAGAYWAQNTMVVIEDLGTDPDEAVAEFREFLRDHGQA